MSALRALAALGLATAAVSALTSYVNTLIATRGGGGYGGWGCPQVQVSHCGAAGLRVCLWSIIVVLVVVC